MTRIYIGRYDLLSTDFPGYGTELHGLHDTAEADVVKEVKRQKGLFPEQKEGCLDSYHHPGSLIGEYTPEEFESLFLEDLDGSLKTEDYWIKIFQ